MILFVALNENMVKIPMFRTGTFKLRSPKEIGDLLDASGFKKVRTETNPSIPFVGVCSIGVK